MSNSGSRIFSAWCQENLLKAAALTSILTDEARGCSSEDPVTRGRKNALWKGLPKRLKRLRSYTSLALFDLAALAGCSHTTVGNVEKGASTPSIATTEGLAVALGVSPTYLSFGHEGYFHFVQKRPVSDLLPVDPMPSPILSLESGLIRDRYKGMPERLIQAREASGRTVRGLAALAGLSAQAVLYIEEGRTVPKVDTCEQLAEALRVSPGWLAYGEVAADSAPVPAPI